MKAARLAVYGCLLGVTGVAHAQSSVTLSGIIDAGFEAAHVGALSGNPSTAAPGNETSFAKVTPGFDPWAFSVGVRTAF